MKSVHRALAGFMTIVLILSAVIAGGSMSGIATTATAGGTSPQLGLLEQESAQVNPQSQAVDVTSPNCGEVSYDGEGSPSDPFLIRSVDQLQCINNNEQDTRRSDRPGLDDNYRLTTDLDAGGTRVWNDGTGFRPIGGFNERFTGTLDGNNHTISGLTIDRGPFDLQPARVGLFRFTGSNAEIEDLTLRDIDIDAGANTGGVVANNNGKVTNVSASGSITGTSEVGGVVGVNDGEVTSVSVSGNVTGEVNVGGVVGFNDEKVTNASVNVSTDMRVVKGTDVTPGSNDIEGVGGLVGGNDGTISNSRVVGIIITGENEVGGLVGSNFGEIQRSYASTGIDGNQRVGGLVGDNGIRGTVSLSYAVSNFADPASVSLLGGLVGGNDGTVFNSYWDEEQSGISFSPGSGSTGLSTGEMTGESAAESMNFDFSSAGIWRTQPEEYPKFRWQVTQESPETPNFEVSDLEPQVATVKVTDAFDVSATIENTGDLQGEQEIELRVEPGGDAVRTQTVSLDPGVTTTVTFQSVTVDTAGEFTHTVASANDSVTGSLTVNQREQEPPTATVTFDDQTVQNGSTIVDVASATFDGTENFNIVVHQATDDNGDGVIQTREIGVKIGESPALAPGTSTDVAVNLTQQLTFSDDVSQLTENQTLVAMLHTTDPTDDDDTVHAAPITRDGTPVFDQADITVFNEGSPASRKVSVGDATVTATDRGTVDVTLNQAPEGVQTANITVSLGNATFGEIEAAEGGAIFGNFFQIVDSSASSITFRAADLGQNIQSGSGQVTLATITITGTNPGDTSIDASVNALVDDQGDTITSTTDSGRLTVRSGEEDEEDGSTIDVTRQVSADEIAPGETVTLSTELSGVSSNGGTTTLTSNYAPEVSSATLQSITVDGTSVEPLIAEATATVSTVTLEGVGANATITVTEELTVAAESDITHEITGVASVGDRTIEFSPVSVTVRKPPADVDVTRTVSPEELSPGETVTLSTEFESATGALSLSSTYTPEMSSATIQSVTVDGQTFDPLIAEATPGGSTITSSDIGTNVTVTITEELTVADETGITHNITGVTSVGQQTAEVAVEPVSVTVTEPQSVVDEYDTDNDGIEIGELGAAGVDFASGELTIIELGEVGAAFASDS